MKPAIISQHEFSTSEVDLAISMLNSKYGFNREHIRQELVCSGINQTADYRGRIMTQSHISDSIFTDTNFDYAALTGSLIRNTSFINCSMEQADLEFCDFTEVCMTTSPKTYGASFNNSNFQDCDIRSHIFDGCTFTGTLFESTKFTDTTIQYCTFENAEFNRCSFNNVHMEKLNLEFSEFRDSDMDNTVLSFAQIPYVFGLLPYLGHAPDSVRITSMDGGTISVQQYLHEALKPLIVYYTRMGDFFPLASIYILRQDKEKAVRAIRSGMYFSGSIRDFRMIKFYCKMAERSQMFTKQELQALYSAFLHTFPENELTPKERHNLVKHAAEIKSVLFANSALSQLQMTLQTDIEASEADKISSVIETIYDIADLTGSERGDIQITLTRNTPITFNIDISDLIQNLYVFVPVALCMTTLATAEITNLVYDIKVKKEELKQKREAGRQEKENRKKRTGMEVKIDNLSDEQVDTLVSALRSKLNAQQINIHGSAYFILDANSNSSMKIGGNTSSVNHEYNN